MAFPIIKERSTKMLKFSQVGPLWVHLGLNLNFYPQVLPPCLQGDFSFNIQSFTPLLYIKKPPSLTTLSHALEYIP